MAHMGWKTGYLMYFDVFWSTCHLKFALVGLINKESFGVFWTLLLIPHGMLGATRQLKYVERLSREVTHDFDHPTAREEPANAEPQEFFCGKETTGWILWHWEVQMVLCYMGDFWWFCVPEIRGWSYDVIRSSIFMEEVAKFVGTFDCYPWTNEGAQSQRVRWPSN